MSQLRASGLAPVGHLAWGCHFCQFYRTRQDMLDVLVPFFAAGLHSNEQCLWVTGKPLDADTAQLALQAAVPDLPERIARGQIEFVDGDAWYRDNGFDAERTLRQWVERERIARHRGYEGLRVTGNTLWVHGKDWAEFAEYERRVTELFKDYRLIAACTYHLDSCSANEVLDVVRNHEFAVARRGGEWEVIEGASVKQAKQALSEAKQTLEQRVVERTRALAEAIQRRDEFLAMLGHELRNPLAPIRNVTHLVRAAAATHRDASLATAGEVLDRQVRQLTRLVDDLLDVARVAQGKISLNVEPTELGVVLAQAVESIRPQLTDRRHRLEQSIPGEKLFVAADRHRLAQVFANLLDNAVKYTQPGGRIGLVVEATGRDVLVRVTDTGVGIEPQLLKGIFEPFTQALQSLARSNGGLGLGLTVVQRLVQMHGGEVQVHSAGAGSGSEFCVRLPLCQAVQTAAPVARPLPVGPKAPAQHILVVDDNVDAAQSLAALLRMAGQAVFVVHDGEAALDYLRATTPQVVILDLGLPGISGYDVAAQIREMTRARPPRVIALTGYGDEVARARSKAAGCALHLTKPVELEALLRALADGHGVTPSPATATATALSAA